MNSCGKTKEDYTKELANKGYDLNSQKQFVSAIKDGSTGIVKLYVEAGVKEFDLNDLYITWDIQGPETVTYPILHYASYKGYTEISKLLIKAGATVDLKYFRTPLMIAVEEGNTETAKELINAGANIKTKGRNDENILIAASLQGNIKLVKLFITLGIDVNDTSFSGDTALVEASYKGNKEIVQLLIKAGAKVNIHRRYSSPLIVTVDQDIIQKDVDTYTEIVKMLVKAGAQVNTYNRNGQSVFQISVKRGYTEILKVLIKNGANIDEANNYEKRTVLMDASEKGDVDKVKLLIDSGADIKLKDRDKKTALDLACINGHVKILKLFLKGKAPDVIAREPVFNETFLEASRHGKSEIVKFLIKRGININAISIKTKRTALMYASWKGYIEIVQTLIKSGAKINLKDVSGWTALVIANQEKHEEISDLLKQSGAEE